MTIEAATQTGATAMAATGMGAMIKGVTRTDWTTGAEGVPATGVASRRGGVAQTCLIDGSTTLVQSQSCQASIPSRNRYWSLPGRNCYGNLQTGSIPDSQQDFALQ